MSWDSYVSDSLVGAGCNGGAVLDLQTGAVWASENLGITEAEGKAVLAAMNASSREKIKVAGKEYNVIQIDNDELKAKQGSTGVIFHKSKQAIVVGSYGQSDQPGNVAIIVTKLAEYLIKSGY